MNPELTELTDRMASDPNGEVYFKHDDGTWESMSDITIKSEQATDRLLRSSFPNGLKDDGDMVYIRVIGGRLQWLKANDMMGDKKWIEYTPTLARKLEAGAVLPAMTHSAAEAVAIQEPESYEIGWYQDIKGDLYQFDGKTWVGRTPSKKEIDALEFLG